MKIYSTILLFLTPFCAFSQVITCGDAMLVIGEAKAVLHKSAQQRAQIEIENFTDKKLTKPYIAAGGFEPVCGGKNVK